MDVVSLRGQRIQHMCTTMTVKTLLLRSQNCTHQANGCVHQHYTAMNESSTHKKRIKRFFLKCSGSAGFSSMIWQNSVSMIFISPRPNFVSGSSLPRSLVHKFSTIILLSAGPICHAASQISGCHPFGANLEHFNFPSKWCMSTSMSQPGTQSPNNAEELSKGSGPEPECNHKLKCVQNSRNCMKCGADCQIDCTAASP